MATTGVLFAVVETVETVETSGVVETLGGGMESVSEAGAGVRSAMDR